MIYQFEVDIACAVFPMEDGGGRGEDVMVWYFDVFGESLW